MFVQNTIFLPSEAWFNPELVLAINKLTRELRATGYTKSHETLGGYMRGNDTCSPSILNPLVLVTLDDAESWVLISQFVLKVCRDQNEQWIYVTRTQIRVADADGNLS